jgi:ferredoxin-NADP reductase
MIVKKYKSIVSNISNPVPGVYKVEFKPLSGKYKYLPGQFLHLALDIDYDGIGQWPESRCFSIQSNTDEENIRITYAVKGRFTKMMEEELEVGSEVWLKLPYGDLFTQHHNKVNTVFIAGGTGITPFLSLFTHRLFNEYINPRIYLAFRSNAYNIYYEEIARSYNSYKFVKFFYEDTDGQLNIRNILIENGTSSDYFLSGPPAMIKTFKNYLNTAGVPSDQIKTDDWE